MFYISQVFKEAATYRGKMKDICEKTFLRYYADMLGVNEFVESQITYQNNIGYHVGQLIGRPSLFHFGLDDIHVSLLLNSRSRRLNSLNLGEKKEPGASRDCRALHQVLLRICWWKGTTCQALS